MRSCLACLILIVGFISASAGDSPKPSEYEPTSNYSQRNVQGWTVFVHRRLLGDEKELGNRALKLLRVKLYDMNRAVPACALAKLHDIPVWLELDDPGFACACFHPSGEWLADNGYNPEKAGAVEIANAARFLQWSRDQPSMVLHELAHAYHHLCLGGYDNPQIAATYRQAVETGSYESVLHGSGRIKRAYALGNPQEYFAELTEAWFGTNDFYPFVRAEVIQHDPEMAQLLKELWGE